MSGKTAFAKPGNFLYPVPAVMVSCADKEGKPNIITVAWAGTICSDPPMVSISVRKSRYSYQLIRESGEFVINLTTEELVRAADFCGVRSGRDLDKFAECRLTQEKSEKISAPSIKESPVSIECVVKQVVELGTHDMFMAEVVCVRVDEAMIDATGKFRMEDADLAVYSHGTYYGLGNMLGTFGYSVRKKPEVKSSGKKSSRDAKKNNPVQQKKNSFRKKNTQSAKNKKAGTNRVNKGVSGGTEKIRKKFQKNR